MLIRTWMDRVEEDRKTQRTQKDNKERTPEQTNERKERKERKEGRPERKSEEPRVTHRDGPADSCGCAGCSKTHIQQRDNGRISIQHDRGTRRDPRSTAAASVGTRRQLRGRACG